MKPFRERFGKQYYSKRLKNENTFAVKYLGSVIKLAKDIKVVENAINQLTDRALSKDLSYQLLGKHFIHVTEDRVALFPKGKIKNGCEVFSIPIEKMSYGFFPPKRNYQILALNKHVSKTEVETYVVCCKTKEKMLDIKIALYSTFKGRYLARLKKRKEEKGISNQYFTHQVHIREEAENPPKNMRNGSLAFSNEVTHDSYPREQIKNAALSNDTKNEYSKEGKKIAPGRETIVDIHHHEQKPKQGETAGTQKNFDIVTVHPMSKMAPGDYRKQSLKNDRGFTSSMC